MARVVTGMLLANSLWGPVAPATAADGGAAAAGLSAQPRGRAAAISGGHDRYGAWLAAEYRDLQLLKRMDRATQTIGIRLRAGGDDVSISVTRGSVIVSRLGRQVVLDSEASMVTLQELLGTSTAIFATRGMLSELETVSTYDAPDTSLLSTAAFVASLVGDAGAPLRIADRFVEKHRGIYRQARMPGGNCWGAYSQETTAAWDDLQGCMQDADDKTFLRAAYERLACNSVWLFRTESAWFEYLNCLSPLSGISQ